jgi:Outer membrane protein beta-barrel domain
MLKKSAAALLILWSVSSISVAQDGSFDVSASAATMFTNHATGNGITQSATIGLWAFGSLRYKFNLHHSILFSYGRAKNSQTYQTIYDIHIPTNTSEYSLVYMYSLFPEKSPRFKPFLLVGGGSLSFSPRSTWVFLPPLPHNVPNNIEINVHAVKQREWSFLYGVGVDYTIPRYSRFALRVQYRGFLYDAPDFKVNAASGNPFSLFTGARSHMAEPSAGVVFRF